MEALKFLKELRGRYAYGGHADNKAVFKFDEVNYAICGIAVDYESSELFFDITKADTSILTWGEIQRNLRGSWGKYSALEDFGFIEKIDRDKKMTCEVESGRKCYFNPTIAFDFDGTITAHDVASPEFDVIPPPKENCVAVMNRLYEEGYTIIINTLRDDGEWERSAKKYLNKHGIPFHLFNANQQQKIDIYGESRKIAADIYVDDRNLGGLPDDFEVIYALIKKQFEVIGKTTFLETKI